MSPETPPTSIADNPLGPLLADFRQEHAVPALGGALVDRDGGLDVDVVGVRIRGGDDPVTRGDRWHIGSCCKSITAVLYARLVERGDAKWGAPLPALFPDLAPAIDPAWATVTIDDVFVSQAGLPANLGRAEMKAAFRDATPLVEQRTAVTAAALARPPRRPGRFLYSNLGYIVIGAAIERITGLPFESALALHVLDPLGVGSAGFGPPPDLWGHGGRMLALGPLGLFDIGGGAPADPERIESDNPGVMSPAGRLHITLEDWATLQRVFLGGATASCGRRRSNICSRPLPDGATGTRSAGHGSTVSTTPPWASRDRIPTGSPPPSSTGSASGPRWSCATKGARGSFGRRPSSPHGSSRRARGSEPLHANAAGLSQAREHVGAMLGLQTVGLCGRLRLELRPAGTALLPPLLQIGVGVDEARLHRRGVDRLLEALRELHPGDRGAVGGVHLRRDVAPVDDGELGTHAGASVTSVCKGGRRVQSRGRISCGPVVDARPRRFPAAVGRAG